MQNARARLGEYVPEPKPTKLEYRHVTLPLHIVAMLDDLCKEYDVKARSAMAQALIKAAHADVLGTS